MFSGNFLPDVLISVILFVVTLEYKFDQFLIIESLRKSFYINFFNLHNHKCANYTPNNFDDSFCVRKEEF